MTDGKIQAIVSSPSEEDTEDEIEDEDGLLPKVDHTEQVTFDQTDRLRGWYEKQLGQIQQVPCKVIVKAWIKKIHPKKQGTYPYNGGKRARMLGLQKKQRGSITKPPWWPPGVSHREPDHLEKKGKSLHMLFGCTAKVA